MLLLADCNMLVDQPYTDEFAPFKDARWKIRVDARLQLQRSSGRLCGTLMSTSSEWGECRTSLESFRKRCELGIARNAPFSGVISSINQTALRTQYPCSSATTAISAWRG